jgi:multidrug efflux system membrane fusion protein
VVLVDNQIDQSTGTIRLKATFPNAQSKLWPGQYIDARVLLKTQKGALTIPAAAVQRGPNGTFAYVVKADSTVEARPVKVGEESGSRMVVMDGIRDGERVVISNQYRLQPGAHVKVTQTGPAEGEPHTEVASDPADHANTPAPLAVSPTPGAKMPVAHSAGRSVQ